MAEQVHEDTAEKGGLRYQGTYAEYKSALDTEIRKTAEGFVKVGYLLKIARDTNILYESGYGSVAEFAQAEYGLTKDVVSRYIAINDKYSEGGYSDRLQDRFQGFGVAKLAEMLTLPDAVIEAMNPQLTKAQIREVKEEVKAEMEITPLEVALEPQDKTQRDLTPLQQFLSQYIRENPFRFREIHRYTTADTNPADDRLWIEKTLDAMCPAGNGCESVRIPGKGRYMLFFHGNDKPLELVLVRENERQEVTWSTLRENVLRFCSKSENPEKAWQLITGEEFPPELTQEEPKQPAAETAKPSAGKTEMKKAEKKTPIGKLADTIRKVTGKDKKEEKAKVAPAQQVNEQVDNESDQNEHINAHIDQENVQIDQEGNHEEGEAPEFGMNPPEEADQEVDYDFWMARKTVQEGIKELRMMLLDADWEGMEKQLNSLLRKVKQIRKEIPEEQDE